jgi:hypothetical protein
VKDRAAGRAPLAIAHEGTKSTKDTKNNHNFFVLFFVSFVLFVPFLFCFLASDLSQRSQPARSAGRPEGMLASCQRSNLLSRRPGRS